MVRAELAIPVNIKKSGIPAGFFYISNAETSIAVICMALFIQRMIQFQKLLIALLGCLLRFIAGIIIKSRAAFHAVFEKITIRELAASAEISKATFYLQNCTNPSSNSC